MQCLKKEKLDKKFNIEIKKRNFRDISFSYVNITFFIMQNI